MNWLHLKSIAALAAAALAAGTGTHLWQQREANRLRSENQNLVALQRQLTTERDAALSTVAASKDELEQWRKDQRELLRLRGEVGAFRRGAAELDKLRAENRELRTSLAETAKSSPSEETHQEADPFKQDAFAKMNAVKVLVLGLIMHANDNTNQFPRSFDDAAQYLGGSTNPALTNLSQFELVIQGSLTNVTNPAETIAVREKEAWFAKGKWFKTYGFADGHSEVHTEPDGRFEAWEKERLLVQPNQ